MVKQIRKVVAFGGEKIGGKSTKGFFEVMEMLYILVEIWVTQVYAIFKIPRFVHLRCVHFNIGFTLKEKNWTNIEI